MDAKLQPTTCRWCDSGEMFGPVYLYPETGAGYGTVAVASTERNRMFAKNSTVPLAVWVCESCGHLEHFATEPEQLHALWSAAKKK